MVVSLAGIAVNLGLAFSLLAGQGVWRIISLIDSSDFLSLLDSAPFTVDPPGCLKAAAAQAMSTMQHILLGIQGLVSWSRLSEEQIGCIQGLSDNPPSMLNLLALSNLYLAVR